MAARSTSRRAAVVAVAAAVLLASCSVRDVDTILARASDVDQTTQVLAADGSVLASLHAEIDRRPVTLAQIPRHVRDAVIAIEDARFYDHPGVDYAAIARALIRNTEEGSVVEGGSTITQQLVKNTMIEPERSLKRKVREAVLAYELERRMSKDEILERYLNTVYFGRGAYGIQAAARTFFSVPASRLTLEQGALLAGVLRSPAAADPERAPDAAIARRNVVLARMRDLGMMDDARWRRATRAPLGLRPAPPTERYDAPYFVEHVKDLIFDGGPGFERLGSTRAERINAVFRGGLRIETTLDPKLQKAAERAVRTTLHQRRDPYGAFVGLDPVDGDITAMVGGRDFFDLRDPKAKFNLAVQARRQPGSVFKPFTLVAALEQGIPLSRTYPASSSATLRLPGGERWRVRNYEGTAFGGSLSLARATALSVNVVYARLVLDVGADRVVEVAHRMGIESPLRAYPSIALGTQEVNPLEIAVAYATLANGGYRVRPVTIKRILAADGSVLYRADRKRTRVLDPAVTAQAVEALRQVLRSGTGRALRLGIPAAGKTGTSEEYHDAWFAGFTPTMVGVSWVGFPQASIPMRPPRTRIRVFGSSWPGRIWRSFMLEAHRGLPAKEFTAPEDVLVRVRVDAVHRCLPNRFTPRFLIEERTFVEGTEPKDVCEVPAAPSAAIPALTGRHPDEARSALLRLGLRPRTERRYCPSVRPGAVCATEPPAGATADVGTTVTLAVSDDDAIGDVPIVLGMSTERAVEVLADAGFRAEVVARANSGAYEGCRDPAVRAHDRVWAQSPCGGARYGRGARVTLYVERPSATPTGSS